MSADPSSSEPSASGKHVLDPIDRVSEILFGLIMVLTFTGSLSVAESGRDDVRGAHCTPSRPVSANASSRSI